MTSHIIIPNNYIQLIWVLSIFFLIRILTKKQNITHSLFDWNYQTKISKITLKSNKITLIDIFNKLLNTSNHNLPLIIRDEMINNASLYFNKPTTYFVKHRDDENIMQHYFNDMDLINFFQNPKKWSENRNSNDIHFFKRLFNRKYIKTTYINDLKYIISIFNNELLNNDNSREYYGDFSI